MTEPNSAHPLFGEAERQNAETLIDLALREDLGPVGDLTSQATIPESLAGAALFRPRKSGVVAGLPVVEILAERLGLKDGWERLANDGDPADPARPIARISGSMRQILAFERTALNFLQRLSGVASLTARFVEVARGTKAQILDTRKTTPGWRLLEKYAVRAGGGRNHRIGLYDAILIKDNHLAALATSVGTEQAIPTAVREARRVGGAGIVVEIEVDSRGQLAQALEARPDIVLVDNFAASGLAEAVGLRDRVAPGVLLEASGGINLDTVRLLAETGVDRISVGALTHSAPALDIGLDFV